MIEKLNDIRNALKNETYSVAIALALTLPDICSQIENGTKYSSRNMYKAWIDKHMAPCDFNFPIPGFEAQTFNGNVCYALRCKVLHNGNFDIEDECNMEFILTRPNTPNYMDGYKYEQKSSPDGSIVFTTYIGIDYICKRLCDSAESFYNSWQNKSDFDEHIFSL